MNRHGAGDGEPPGRPSAAGASEAADWQRVLVDEVEDYAIFLLDPEGRITRWNRGAERTTGFPAGEVLGRRFTLLHPEGSRRGDMAGEELRTALRQGRYEEERWLVRADGTRFWANEVLVPLRQNGRLIGFGKILRNLTERKLREEEQAAYARRLAAVVEIQRELAASELDLRRVMQLIAERARDLTGTAGAVVALVEGDALVYRAGAGTGARHVGERVPIEASLCGEAIRTGDVLLSNDTEADPRASIEAARRTGMRSMAVVPLVHRGKTLGVLKVTSPEPSCCGPEELDMLRLLAGAIGSTLSHASAFEAEEALVRERTEALDFQRFLSEASRILASSLDYEETLRKVAHLAVSRIADWCIVYMAAGSGEFERLEIAHRDPAVEPLAKRLSRYPPGTAHPVRRVIESGEPMLLREVPDEVVEKTAQNEEHYRILKTIGFRSVMIAPLIARGDIFGAIAYGLSEPGRAYDEDDLARAVDLAGRAALAIDNARLFGAARAAEERWRFLAEASAVLASSLEHEATLARLARLAVPRLADWCVVDLAEERPSGEVRHAATAHADPGKEALLRQYRRYYPLEWTGDVPAARVFRYGEPLLLREVTDEMLESLALDVEQVRMLRELGIASAIAVPLMARGETIGAITLARASEDRAYGPADLELAVELGRRAATLIDNNRLYEQAVIASKAKSDFLAVMSHELRTPLNAIVGYADLLELGIAGPPTGRQQEQIERIKASARHFLDLIEEILTFSRMETEREEVRLEEVDLAALARESAEVIEPTARQKGLAFQVRLPEEPIPGTTDPPKVRRILLNLLNNAVKFTDEGGVELRMAVEVDRVVFTVQDTGIGIAPEHLGRIFEPFWQEQEALTRHVGGTGLGLTVARGLARLLGGDIEVESVLGEGSTFTVRLPAQAAKAGKGAS